MSSDHTAILELCLPSARHFQDGDYKQAESLYSQAYVWLYVSFQANTNTLTNSIQKDSTNPKIFTNRAMTRLKLESWDGVMNDCLKAIDLERGNMKAYYYLAQAQLELNHPNEALSSALTAYDRCLETWSPSTQAVSGLVLQAKKQKWEARERERIRGRSELLRELEDGLMAKQKKELSDLRLKMLDFSDEAEEKADIQLANRKKIGELRSIFAIADPKNMQRRVRQAPILNKMIFVLIANIRRYQTILSTVSLLL